MLVSQLNGSNGSYTNTDDHDHQYWRDVYQQANYLRGRNNERFRGHGAARNNHPDLNRDDYFREQNNFEDDPNNVEEENPMDNIFEMRFWEGFFATTANFFRAKAMAYSEWLKSSIDMRRLTINTHIFEEETISNSALLAKDENVAIVGMTMDERIDLANVRKFFDDKSNKNKLIRDGIDTDAYLLKSNDEQIRRRFENEIISNKARVSLVEAVERENVSGYKVDLVHQELRGKIIQNNQSQMNIRLIQEKHDVQMDKNTEETNMITKQIELLTLKERFEEQTIDERIEMVIKDNELKAEKVVEARGKNQAIDISNRKSELELEYREPILTQEITLNDIKIRSQQLNLQMEQRTSEARLQKTMLEVQMQASLLLTNNLKNQQLERLIAQPAERENYIIGDDGMLFNRKERSCCEIMTSCCIYNTNESTQIEDVQTWINQERKRNFSGFKRFLSMLGVSYGDFMGKNKYSRFQIVQYYPELSNKLVNHFSATVLGEHTFTSMWARCKEKQEFSDRLPPPSALTNKVLRNTILIAIQVISYMNEENKKYLPLN